MSESILVYDMDMLESSRVIFPLSEKETAKNPKLVEILKRLESHNANVLNVCLESNQAKITIIYHIAGNQGGEFKEIWVKESGQYCHVETRLLVRNYNPHYPDLHNVAYYGDVGREVNPIALEAEDMLRKIVSVLGPKDKKLH